MDYIDLACKVAIEAHKGQKDKGGSDYINHLIFVANNVKSDDAKSVAYLHDTVEDTTMTLGMLKELGFKSNIIEAVDVITKKDGIDYYMYLENISRNELAYEVKLADMKHNSDISRISNPSEKDKERKDKYEKGIAYLKALKKHNETFI